MSPCPTESGVRADIDAWLRSNWDPEQSLISWRAQLASSGWAVPSWPEQWYGKGLPAWADRVVAQAIRQANAVGVSMGSGMSLAAPTILAHGSDDLKQRILWPTVTGEVTWCQLFSEPGAGSDLAGLATTAVLDGDSWTVNGQKAWNTSAHHADYAMLLARTDWDAPKHLGISYFVLPMHQEGIDVRPILQMNGHSSFNEVFVTDAQVPAANMVGSPGDGWRAARTTLMHERTFASMGRDSPSDAVGRTRREAAAEADEYFRTYVWYPQRAGRPELVIPRAQANGTAKDPVVRQEIMKLHSLVLAHEWTAQRATAARRQGRPPGPEGSLGKLGRSEVARRSARVHSVVSGAAAMLTAGHDQHDGTISEVLVSTPAQSIAGGTDEIQRNIIGEKILGLPREPAPDRDVSFRDVERN